MKNSAKLATNNYLNNPFFWTNKAKIINKISVSIFAIFLVMFLTWLLLLGFSEYDSGQLFKVFFYNPFRSFNQMKKVLLTFAPFFVGALAVWMCLKIGLINIGVSGQMSFSALSVYFSVFFLKKTAFFQKTLTPLLWLPLLFLIGILAAALLASFCGFLKVYFNVNEVLSTIFVNYIVYHLYRYLINLETVIDSTTKLRTANSLGDSIFFNVFVGVLPLTFFLSLLFFFAAVFVYQKTKLGFQLKVLKAGESISKYSGINIKKMSLSIFAGSGILSGIAGIFYYFGDLENTYLYVNDALPSNGFDTISIVWLSQSSLFALPFVSFFVALIRTQQKVIPLSSINPVIVEVIVGFMILSVAFFTNFDNYQKFLNSKQWQELKFFYQNPKTSYLNWKQNFAFTFLPKKYSLPPLPKSKIFVFSKLKEKIIRFCYKTKKKREKENNK